MTEPPLAPDPWPEPPQLPRPVIMHQRWLDAVFLHWRIPEAVAAPSARRRGPGPLRRIRLGGPHRVPAAGRRVWATARPSRISASFTEINVRLYSREPDGTRGVVFLSLDASRLAAVLAARAAGIPYVWSRTSVPAAWLARPRRPPVHRVFGAPVPGRCQERFRCFPGARRRSHRSVVRPPHRPVRSAHPVPRPHAVHSQYARPVAAVPRAG